MIWLWSLYAIVRRVFAERPKLERYMVGVVLLAAVPMLLLSVAARSALPIQSWMIVLWLLLVGMFLQLLVAVFRKRASEQALLLLGLGAMLALGAYDFIFEILVASRYYEVSYAGFIAGSLDPVGGWQALSSGAGRRAAAAKIPGITH
jgi:hypothetical protein